jgi:hypothetical protein
MALKVVKGLTRTVRCEVGRPSSIPGGVWGGGTNREVGRGLISRGVSCVGGMGGEGHSETGGGGVQEDNGERWGYIGALDVGRAGVLGDGIGGTGS